MPKICFLFDEHIDPRVATGLRRLGIDVLAAGEAELLGAPDTAYVDLARASGRVLVTHDRGFLRRRRNDFTHPGIAFCEMNTRSIGQLIESLQQLWESSSPDDIVGQVKYL